MASAAPKGKLFDKILIANRGEIACRVIKTCKRLGIKTVAIHSDVDKDSVHVRMADEAVCVGPAQSAQSYLNIPRIVQACRDTGAQAVHPGYGFLSEKVEFQEALEEHGIAFIGPKAYALTQMGDKIASKQMARDAKVNTIPGFLGILRTPEEIVRVANEIGYPVMIKASMGGGGKGMRVAWDDEEAKLAFRLCTQEAISSFGSDTIFVEKFIENPRHIEIQLLADAHGNAIYLNERECSVQRRNQKVIEEAPSVFLDPETRKAMGEQAVALAKQVKYQSAGTCEFLVDKHRNFYFLEMNTRLQVEHPVTEEITGVDLVEHMIRVAAGEQLALKQSDIGIKGWALESRVYAEDPLREFLPSIGRLKRYVEPTGEGVRCDSGISEGLPISIYYDPMICKLITYGKDRNEALAKMRAALDSYVIRGVTHNINFLRSLCDHPRFIAGDLTTNFIPEEYPKGYKGHQLTGGDKHTLIAAAVVLFSRTIANQVTVSGGQPSFDAAAFHKAKLNDLVVVLGEESFPVSASVEFAGVDKQSLVVRVADQELKVASPYQKGDLTFETVINGESNTLQVLQAGEGLGAYSVQFLGTSYDLAVMTSKQHKLMAHMPKKEVLDTSKLIQSPMPGAVFSINVKVGDKVVPGQEVCVIEAMKMQNVLRSQTSGVVKAIKTQQGKTVARDEIIIEFE